MVMGIKRGHEAETTATQKSDITEDEAALYDRQIRLWGLESQKRLRNAKVLLVGLGGLGAEVAKNIALAGVKSVVLLDNEKVDANDRSAQFLLCDSDIGKYRSEGSRSSVQQLNPNVEVICETGPVGDKSDDYFSQFNVVCATDCTPDVLYKLNNICRGHQIQFFCGDTWGFHGYCFVDLGTYTYLASSAKKDDDDKNDEPSAKKQKTQQFANLKFKSLERALSFKSGKSGVGLHKKISKIFLLLHILFKFRELHQRLPEAQNRQADIENLKSVRKSVMEKLGFDENKVNDDDLSNVFGDISPVCAIVGGVLSQEIIKAVCADEQPIQNFFLFNGDSCLGVVESVG